MHLHVSEINAGQDRPVVTRVAVDVRDHVTPRAEVGQFGRHTFGARAVLLVTHVVPKLFRAHYDCRLPLPFGSRIYQVEFFK